MRIFDGVELKPTLSPTAQSAISLALLLANTVLEAGNCRSERVAGEADAPRPTTFEQVMQQSGLQIPGIQEALEQLMGGGEEAKQTASLIVNNPDPAVLVRKFAERLGLRVTTTPAPSPTSATGAPTRAASPLMTPAPAPMMEPLHFHEGFAHGVREAPASVPAARPPEFRADYTREAREAAKAATAGPQAAGAIVNQRSTSAPSAATETPSAARPSLVGMVEQQIGASRRRMKAQETELDARLKGAEAELAALRRELQELRRARAAAAMTTRAGRAGEPQVPSAPVAASTSAAEADPFTGDALAAEPVVAGEPAPGTLSEVASDPAQTVADVAHETNAAADTRIAGGDTDLAFHAASEEEVSRTVALVREFAEDVEDHHQRLAGAAAIERELDVMRALVDQERAAGEPGHG